MRYAIHCFFYDLYVCLTAERRRKARMRIRMWEQAYGQGY